MAPLKVIRSSRKPRESEEPAKTGVSATPCPACGRIWIRSEGVGMEDCPHCETKLFPVSRDIVAGEELRLAGGYEARVSQDKLLRGTADILRGLLNQTTCDCTKGVRCTHCQAVAVLREFPGPEGDSMEDDWATLRGRPKREDPVRSFSEDETARYHRLLDDNILADDAPAPEEEESVWATLLRDWGEPPRFRAGDTVEVAAQRRGRGTQEECRVADIDGNEAWIPTSLLQLRRIEGEGNAGPVVPTFPDIFSDV